MYKVGDLIVYGNSGVCEVQDITEVDVQGQRPQRLYYILHPLYQSYTVSTPVDSDKVFMRPVITRDEAEQLIHNIPSLPTEIYYNDSIKQLAEHYEAIISTFDCQKLMRLARSIYVKNQMRVEHNRKPGAIDQRYMKRAEELLYGEFAVALAIPKAEVPRYIAENVAGQAREA
jgi:CarD family transcriptional regulator